MVASNAIALKSDRRLLKFIIQELEDLGPEGSHEEMFRGKNDSEEVKMTAYPSDCAAC